MGRKGNEEFWDEIYGYFEKGKKIYIKGVLLELQDMLEPIRQQEPELLGATGVENEVLSCESML